MGYEGGSETLPVEDEHSLKEVVTDFPTIVSQEETKQYIKLVVGVFVAIGAGLAIPYIFVSALGLTDAITGDGGIMGGAAILSLFGIVPLFGSLIVAVVLGLFVGMQLDDERYAIVAAGVGSYLGFLGMVLALVVSVQFVDTSLVTSVLGLRINSLLQELIVAGVGVGIAGAGGGYIGYEMQETAFGATPDGEPDDETEPLGLVASVTAIPTSVKDEQAKSAIKLSVYAFAVLGIGYGVMVIALGWIAGAFVGVMLTMIASYAVVFSAPFLAVYLGMKIGESTAPRHSVAAGSVGALLGFAVLILVMTILGSFGPNPSVLDAVEGAGAAAGGDVQAAGSSFISSLLGFLPYGYEVSRVMIIGAIGSAIAGGLAAYSTDELTEGAL